MIDILRPYKSDIRQIEALAKLGVNQNDIASILGITSPTLEKWKSKPEIEKLLKPQPRPEYTIHHIDFADKVEEAFTAGGIRYYRFKDEFRMSSGRYRYYYAALMIVNLGMSRDKLQQYLTAFEEILNGGKKGDNTRLGRLWELVFAMKRWTTKLAFEPQGAKNLAAVAYFDETEDLTTYNEEYGQKKIKIWEDNNVYDFFLTKPISELLGLNNTSTTALVDYLKTAEGVLTDLSYGLQKASEES